MNDPLTSEEKDHWLTEFSRRWDRKYRRILATGWLASDEGLVAATMAIILTAREYQLSNPDHQDLLKRIEEWV